MKVRISEQVLQFRLSAENLENLANLRRLQLQIEVTPAMSLNFALIIGVTGESAGEVGLVTSNGRIELTLPSEQFDAWNRSHEIEWELRPANSSMTFLIEKDLKDQRMKHAPHSTLSKSWGETQLAEPRLNESQLNESEREPTQ